MTKRNKKGFTLVELIIVIAIIGILAGVLFPTITGYLKKARISTHEQEAAAINNVLAVESIFNDVNYFQPQELETLLVGMDYELTSTVDDYAFVYDVSKNRVEFIPVSDAILREKVGSTVYEGIESVFGNHLAYIDQSDTSIRRTIDGLRSLVADATSEVSNRQEGTNTTPVNNYQRVLDKMEELFNEMVPAESESTDPVHVNFRKFSPKNGGLYIDQTGMYGDLSKTVKSVVFTPMISTIPTPYAGLRLLEGLIIELPSSVELVETSAFGDITVIRDDDDDDTEILEPLANQKPVIKSSADVRFIGSLSTNINRVETTNAVSYKPFTGYTLEYGVQIPKIGDDNIFAGYVMDPSKAQLDSNLDNLAVGYNYSLIPLLTINNDQVSFTDLVSIDIRSKIYGNVQIITAAAVDKNFNGYKLTNIGAILNVNHTESDIYSTDILSQSEILGRRFIVSNPIEGYTLNNLSNLTIKVKITGIDEFVELSKVTNTSHPGMDDSIRAAYLGDYYFEALNTDQNNYSTEIIEAVQVFATVNNVQNVLVFTKKIK